MAYTGSESCRRAKEIGESAAAPIAIGEATLEEATRRAKEKLNKEVRAGAKDIERAIDKA